MPRKRRPPPPPPEPQEQADEHYEVPQLPRELRETLSPQEAQQILLLLAELASRQIEALNLYVPLPYLVPFHVSGTAERILRGSNRAGKTLAAAAEFALAVCGKDPHGKYPASGKAFVVGQNQEQLSGVIYEKLFLPGAFKIIRDQEAGDWRAFEPRGRDVGRAADARPAPPLIPPRLVQDVAWEDRKRGVPRKVTLTTGWTITFFASHGDCPNGQIVDLVWVDEELEKDRWYTELSARLLDRHGLFLWSATPQVASEYLFRLHERFEEGDVNVAEWLCLITDNPHISDEAKEKFLAKLSPEERRVRYDGEFSQSGYKVYPEWDRKLLAFNVEGWQVPAAWARYLIVDPGRQVCACLFLATPPPDKGNFRLVYDELYIKNCDATRFAEAVAAKSARVVYEALIIDSHAARVTEMGSGLTVEEQYRQALKRLRVQGKNGTYFIPGADDPKAGILKVHDWLRIRDDGTTFLRVARGRLPNLDHEASRYHHKRVNGLVVDEVEKKNDHLMDCLRYAAVHGCPYRKPKVADAAKSAAVKALERKRKVARERQHARPETVHLGSGGSWGSP